MQTETNKKSPLQAIPPALIMPLVKAGAGATGGFFSEMIHEGRQEDTKDKNIFGKVGSVGMAGLKGVLSGLSKGLVGTDFGLSKKDKDAAAAEKAEQEKIRKEMQAAADRKDQLEKNQLILDQNIKRISGPSAYDAMDEPSPVKMLTKELKGIKGLVPPNMSAAQYKSSLQMKEISGVNTLTN